METDQRIDKHEDRIRALETKVAIMENALQQIDRIKWLVIAALITGLAGLISTWVTTPRAPHAQSQRVEINRESDSQQPEAAYMTAEELAEKLGRSRDSVYDMAKDGRLPDKLYEPRDHERMPYRFYRDKVSSWLHDQAESGNNRHDDAPGKGI